MDYRLPCLQKGKSRLRALRPPYPWDRKGADRALHHGTPDGACAQQPLTERKRGVRATKLGTYESFAITSKMAWHRV